MKKSLSLKLSSIFSAIVLVTCVILVSTCGVIFKLTESTIKDIRYDEDVYKRQDLNNVLDKHFKDAIGGVHILPFFPSSGDRGFAPMDYHKVDSAFGDWTEMCIRDSSYAVLVIRGCDGGTLVCA